ncbi:MAG: hypothetical protein Q4G03_09290 [Planctomycetia bacterium]|nr:hypothetical protein [Planctomycetia bacterium]
MSPNEHNKTARVGFLTALGDCAQGVIGGFLVLNLVGRPTEFHCTAPVRPNRAQEILFGNTLECFVYGEQIAPALIGRVKTDLVAIFTNLPSMLTASPFANAPVCLVFQHARGEKSAESDRYAVWDRHSDSVKSDGIVATGVVAETSACETPKDSLDCAELFHESLTTIPFMPGVDFSLWREASIGKNRLALPRVFSTAERHETYDEILTAIEPFFKAIDSVEPFERIKLAVEEAQKSY